MEPNERCSFWRGRERGRERCITRGRERGGGREGEKEGRNEVGQGARHSPSRSVCFLTIPDKPVMDHRQCAGCRRNSVCASFAMWCIVRTHCRSSVYGLSCAPRPSPWAQLYDDWPHVIVEMSLPPRERFSRFFGVEDIKIRRVLVLCVSGGGGRGAEIFCKRGQ